MNKPIPVFIINLKKRIERKTHILHEFEGLEEFKTQLVEAKENKTGAIGLWDTVKHILRDLTRDKDEFIILCEDDHHFTRNYSKEYFIARIKEAQAYHADILSGGVSGFTSIVQTSDNLWWVEKFSGLQFTVIFRKFFQAILDADFRPGDAADYKLCSLAQNKFFIYPFVSIQKNFGYSDATAKNNTAGRVEKLFAESKKKITLLKKVSAFYRHIEGNNSPKVMTNSLENVIIPTYIIHLPERADREAHINKQFQGKSEFSVKIIEACKHKIGAVGLWLSIRKVVRVAMDRHDDVIIICEDDHEFTKHYSKEYLLRSIIYAHECHVDLLSGGTAYFDTVLPVTANLFWVNEYYSTQFIIMFKKFFQRVLDEPFDEKVVADGLFSEMTANKMLLYPFISVQKEFGYSDCTLRNDRHPGLVGDLFIQSNERLEIIKKTGSKFLPGNFRTETAK